MSRLIAKPPNDESADRCGRERASALVCRANYYSAINYSHRSHSSGGELLPIGAKYHSIASKLDLEMSHLTIEACQPNLYVTSFYAVAIRFFV
jgi:hypothetical protein